jgi:hypothetical protein
MEYYQQDLRNMRTTLCIHTHTSLKGIICALATSDKLDEFGRKVEREFGC